MSWFAWLVVATGVTGLAYTLWVVLFSQSGKRREAALASLAVFALLATLLWTLEGILA